MYTMRPEQMLQALAAGIVELLVPSLPMEMRPQADAIAAVARHLSIGLPRRHVLLAQENGEILAILRQARQVLMPRSSSSTASKDHAHLLSEAEELVAVAGKAGDPVELNVALKACLERVIKAVDADEDQAADEDLKRLNASIAAYLRAQLDKDLASYDTAFARGWRTLRTACSTASILADLA